jgi:hypothetical protein
MACNATLITFCLSTDDALRKNERCNCRHNNRREDMTSGRYTLLVPNVT